MRKFTGGPESPTVRDRAARDTQLQHGILVAEMPLLLPSAAQNLDTRDHTLESNTLSQLPGKREG